MVEVFVGDVGDVGKAEAGVATEQEHVETSPEGALVVESQGFEPVQFFGGQVGALAFLVFDLVFSKWVFLQIENVFVDGQVDVTFEVFHVLGYRIAVVLLVEQVVFEVGEKIEIQIVEADFRTVLREYVERGEMIFQGRHPQVAMADFAFEKGGEGGGG